MRRLCPHLLEKVAIRDAHERGGVGDVKSFAGGLRLRDYLAYASRIDRRGIRRRKSTVY